MSLEEDIERIRGVEGVDRVSVDESDETVEVVYYIADLYEDWPYGASDGTAQQRETYYQEVFGVDWSLEGRFMSSELDTGFEMAVFNL